jgi:predicted Zn-dependent protease
MTSPGDRTGFGGGLTPAGCRAAPRPRLAGRARPTAAAGVALTALGLVAGCGGLDLGSTNVFGLDDEWRLGAQLAADLRREVTLDEDPEVVRAINELGQELVRHGRLADRPWELHVVRDDELNAFNIPGGHVYVHSGLIRAAGDASELMSVLAHETAHGMERHGTQQLTKAYGITLLLDLALGRSPGVLAGIGANIAAGGTLAHYSREAEREADAEGLRLLTAAGWDPEGMVRMFERLIERRQRQPNDLERFFASHPMTETRLADTRRRIAELPAGQGYRRDSETFRRLQQRVAR